MSLQTFSIIILILSLISISMTLIAAYYVVLLKYEKSKNPMKSKTTNKNNGLVIKPK